MLGKTNEKSKEARNRKGRRPSRLVQALVAPGPADALCPAGSTRPRLSAAPVAGAGVARAKAAGPVVAGLRFAL